jgi:demethylmenaquinone methyltransferase/2-methoxy-6-polyprenyl-1,4-benzoquinol methylase
MTTEPERRGERVPPHAPLRGYYGADPKRRYVVDLFDRSAKHYDTIEALFLNGGLWYRRFSLRRAGLGPGMKVLDVAIGTAAVARGAARLVGPAGAVFGVDPSAGMLARARTHFRGPLTRGVAEELPFAGGTFDFVTMGIALRHVSDLVATFREYRRVLRPGGTLWILEAHVPRSGLAHRLTRLVWARLVPALTLLFTRSRDAKLLMDYYWDTIDQAVPPRAIVDAMREAGFDAPRYRLVVPGAFCEYTATRPAAERATVPARPTTRPGGRLAARLGGIALAAAIGLLGASSPVSAQQDRELEPAALATLRRMADHLRGLRSLRVAAEVEYDALQASGQTLEFGSTREIAVRRPDRMRATATDRSGGERSLFYDGRQLTVLDRVERVYATTEKTGDVDAALRYAGEQLGIPVPLGELLSSDLGARLDRELVFAAVVGTETISGVRCDHLALRNADRGIQIWVEQGKTPLPRRISITWEQAPGRPPFRARLMKWELSPELPDALFAFDPPAGMERIQFHVRPARPAAPGGR